MPDKIFVVKDYSIGGGPKRSGEAVSLNREAGSAEIGDAVMRAIHDYKDYPPGTGHDVSVFTEDITKVYHYKNYRVFYKAVEAYFSVYLEGSTIEVTPMVKDGRGFEGAPERAATCQFNQKEIGALIIDMLEQVTTPE